MKLITNMLWVPAALILYGWGAASAAVAVYGLPCAPFDAARFECNAVASPSPAPTLTPIPELSVALVMPATFYYPGDRCGLTAVLNNPGGPISQLPLAVVLDIHGAYFFWPSWEPFPPFIDYRELPVPGGRSQVVVIGPFLWPAGAGADDGLSFTGALLSPNLREIVGQPGMWVFGYGE